MKSWLSETWIGNTGVITFCEEPRAAYDRVGLTSFFAHRDAEKLMLAKMAWYEANGVELHLGDRATEIDRQAGLVRSDKGVEIRLRRRGVGHWLIPLRAAGAGHQQTRRVRLPHH